MKYFDKLKSRTEWQALIAAVAIMIANRVFELGLTTADIYAMFGGAGSYAVGRGLAKGPDDSGTVAEATPSPDELGT